MKLIDLNPRWIGHGGEGIYDENYNPISYQHGVALECDCPVCGVDHPLVIFIDPPIEGNLLDNQRLYWKRIGEDFQTLTLTPSIQRMDKCKWHGFIRNGEIITV